VPRFELAKSREVRFFWEVDVLEDPPALRTCFGRVGDAGNETIREQPSVAAARKELGRLVGAKRAEGYVEVQYLPERATHPDLEKRLASDPDDLQTLLVYADWLQSKRDPRGELIALQHRLETAKKGKREIRERIRRLLDENELHFFGDAAGSRRAFDLEWKRGWAVALSLRVSPADVDRAETLLRELLVIESCRRLESLRFETIKDHPEDLGGPELYLDGLLAVAADPKRRPANLKALTIHSPDVDCRPVNPDFEDEEGGRVRSMIDAGNLARLSWRTLESLDVDADVVKLRGLDLPALRALRLFVRDLADADAADLAAPAWPALERLELLLPITGNVGAATLDRLVSARLPRLAHLSLQNVEDADGLCASIVSSRLAATLVSLDLRDGGLTDDGAATLARAKKRLPRLEALDVRGCVLTKSGAIALSRLCPGASVGAQRSHPGEHAELRRWIYWD
jgi:uncharacterized protein (TIGR02996 family)